MISSIYNLFLVRCSISVVSLSFLRTRLSYGRKYPNIPDLTVKARKNYSCVMGMKISDYDSFFMAESSIWWVVLSGSTNLFYAWE